MTRLVIVVTMLTLAIAAADRLRSLMTAQVGIDFQCLQDAIYSEILTHKHRGPPFSPFPKYGSRCEAARVTRRLRQLAKWAHLGFIPLEEVGRWGAQQHSGARKNLVEVQRDELSNSSADARSFAVLLSWRRLHRLMVSAENLCRATTKVNNSIDQTPAVIYAALGSYPTCRWA
jgi:hypothetical protein